MPAVIKQRQLAPGTRPGQEAADKLRQQELRLLAVTASIINYKFLGEFCGAWLFDGRRRGGPSEVGGQFDFSPRGRGRKPAYNFHPIGRPLFGPPLPDGDGSESVYRIESRKGKQQVLTCLHDGRPAELRSEVGSRFEWHADNNLAVFGAAKRGEVVRLRNRGLPI